MSSSLSTIMFPPPPGPADPYDVPPSPMKAKKKTEGRSTPSGGRVMTPARDSSIGRDIIRDIDIDRYERTVDTTVIAAVAPAPEIAVSEPIVPPPKQDSIDPQTLQKQPEPEPVVAPAVEPVAEPTEPAEPVAEPQEAEAEPASLDTVADLGEVEIESFETHRVDEDNATVDILVKWANGEQTWEPEWSLQQQVPALIYKYWDDLDGREAATGLDIYHVFRVLKRTLPPKGKKKEYMYQVQWVGYRKSESTWEHESKLAQIAPEELIKYEAKNGSAPEAPAPKLKRGIARGPGRPRKRAKSDE